MKKQQWKRVQAWLILSGFTAGGELVANGKPGASTRAALKSYQKEREMRETGLFCQDTADMMVNFVPYGWAGITGKHPLRSVKEMQCVLLLLGYTSGGRLIADGVEGKQTIRAFREFCRASFEKDAGLSIKLVLSKDEFDESDCEINPGRGA